MNISTFAYQQLPKRIQPIVKQIYNTAHPHRLPESKKQHHRSEFISTFFDSQQDYESYLHELYNGDVASFLSMAKENHRKHRDDNGLSNEYFHHVYAYIRQSSPDVVVETGVRDGWSTLYILAALQKNQHGTLYSIDYPINENDEEIDEFKQESPSYSNTTPTIPSGTNPGWIVPEDLKRRWNLVLGKSQEKLPKVFVDVGQVDVFIHDSDHSHPCMMFEYELAWEWFSDAGILFSDDINWNSAFDDFVASKGCSYGKLTNSFGYIIKEYTD